MGVIDGQECPSSREGEVDGQDCPSSREGEVDGQECPSSKEGEVDGQECPSSRDGMIDGQECPSSRDFDTGGGTSVTPSPISSLALSGFPRGQIPPEADKSTPPPRTSNLTPQRSFRCLKMASFRKNAFSCDPRLSACWRDASPHPTPSPLHLPPSTLHPSVSSRYEPAHPSSDKPTLPTCASACVRLAARAQRIIFALRLLTEKKSARLGTDLTARR